MTSYTLVLNNSLLGVSNRTLIEEGVGVGDATITLLENSHYYFYIEVDNKVGTERTRARMICE